MSYNVLCSNSLDELVGWVEKAIQSGWKCQGGIAAATIRPHYTVFYQAIILDK